MNFTYRKSTNLDLFKDFEKSNLVNTRNSQNYSPIYTNFFKLSSSNYNTINLNHKYSLTNITEKITENKYKGTITNNEPNNEPNNTEATIFIKYAPLLDPFKFLAGKYDLCTFELPNLDSKCKIEKIDCPNNSAYIDGFFIYLSSQLLNYKGFLHGINFYGSFLGIKNEYIIDISDDLDMLDNSKFFNENKQLYKFVNSEQELLFNDKSKRHKKALKIANDYDISLLEIEIIETIETQNPITEICYHDSLVDTIDNNKNVENIEGFEIIESLETIGTIENIESLKNKEEGIEYSSSDISSRSSNSNSAENNENNDVDSDTDNGDSDNDKNAEEDDNNTNPDSKASDSFSSNDSYD